MTELRAQVNVRLGADLNMSVSLTSFADEETAITAGEHDARLMRLYMDQFGATWDAINEERQ